MKHPIFTIAGLVAVVSGLIGLGTIAYWYAVDTGWTGSGSTIVVSRMPIAVTAIVPAAAVAFGLVTFLVRDDVPARSPGGVAVVAVNLLIALSVLAAVDAYPQVENAELLGLDDEGTIVWRTELPLTDVFGMRDQTEETVTVEGGAHRRECDSEPRSVTLDRSTGEILEIVALPRTYPDASAVPPAPTPIVPGLSDFSVVQGSTPFICPN